MPCFYKTKLYARSHAGRALIHASQFAHVSVTDLWRMVDAAEDEHGHYLRLWPASSDGTQYVVCYDLAALLSLAENTFGVLCGICLTPVQKDNATRCWSANFPDLLHAYNEPAAQIFCHSRCRGVDWALRSLESNRNAARYLFRNEFANIRKIFAEAEVLPLRFNPRIANFYPLVTAIYGSGNQEPDQKDIRHERKAA